MPRKRMIDPEFWSDEEIAAWSYQARLFYIGLWNFADDEGRFKAHSKLLRSQIFPYDERINIEKLKKEVSTKVQWYSNDSQFYGFLPNLLKHQRIDRPTASKLPIPPPFVDDSTNNHRGLDPNILEVKLSKDKSIYVDFEESTFASWNSFCEKYPTLSPIKEISTDRRDKLKRRYEIESFRGFSNILQAVKDQPFLLGENDRKWKITFDWLIENNTNYLKVLEGRYKSKSRSDIKAADPECKVCEGTGFAIIEGVKNICPCRKVK